MKFGPLNKKKIELMNCSICELPIEIDESGWHSGHNASPVNDGRCCTVCDMEVVEPTRYILENLPKSSKLKKMMG